ncbi:hypothetical protein TWF718_000954 [Orbilia javanica]|uniref:Uncharacterized protein n=1 Tax=Orbilia javanica TaxID=47235 RepID=A0AAN8N4Y2_9PEZI
MIDATIGLRLHSRNPNKPIQKLEEGFMLPKVDFFRRSPPPAMRAAPSPLGTLDTDSGGGVSLRWREGSSSLPRRLNQIRQITPATPTIDSIPTTLTTTPMMIFFCCGVTPDGDPDSPPFAREGSSDGIIVVVGTTAVVVDSRPNSSVIMRVTVTFVGTGTCVTVLVRSGSLDWEGSICEDVVVKLLKGGVVESPPASVPGDGIPSSPPDEVGAGSTGVGSNDAGSDDEDIAPSELETCRLCGLSSRSELEMSRDDKRMATSNSSKGSDAVHLMSFMVLQLKSVG